MQHPTHHLLNLPPLTLRSQFKPTRQLGVKARDRKCVRGYQNQYWQNTSSPTTAPMLVWPVRDCKEMVQLRPPARNHATESYCCLHFSQKHRNRR